jgi:hypothetical protein
LDFIGIPPIPLISLEISYAKAAESLCIIRRQYQRLEAGVSVARYIALIICADLFGVSMDYLAGRTDNPEINR